MNPNLNNELYNLVRDAYIEGLRTWVEVNDEQALFYWRNSCKTRERLEQLGLRQPVEETAENAPG